MKFIHFIAGVQFCCYILISLHCIEIWATREGARGGKSGVCDGMGLLWMDYGPEFQNLVDKAYEYERAEHAAYFSRLDAAQQRHFREDTRYNVDFLRTALTLGDSRVIETYAVWLYELMAGIFKQQDNASEQALRCVLNNISCIERAAVDVLDPKKLQHVQTLLAAARECVLAYVHGEGTSTACPRSVHQAEVDHYLDLLFSRNTRGAMSYVRQLVDGGMAVDEVYVGVLACAMRRVGELWHAGVITVDVEHYCTATTQTAMSQLYARIFAAPRRGKTVLVACPGAELHEMPARMVADLFENDGWDSVYLGAAVPQENLLAAVAEHKPDLVALSVTMPQFLVDCERAVCALKQTFPQVKIAVGGRAFESTHEIWRTWPIDYFAHDARELISAADAAAE